RSVDQRIRECRPLVIAERRPRLADPQKQVLVLYLAEQLKDFERINLEILPEQISLRVAQDRTAVLHIDEELTLSADRPRAGGRLDHRANNAFGPECRLDAGPEDALIIAVESAEHAVELDSRVRRDVVVEQVVRQRQRVRIG